ncbi:MAG TPA: electron transport complex subunit RsxA [Bacillota bacterium]|jgi:electron transport complex protein RnfA|nr:electron transport complex subunit RsxA [Bacillota bacterium]HOB86761.1 electron transport complex subunit RsxA [Bacillota bacterium]HOP69655.1 electron transport complex subunit RsxA [Bacillota bacterium]HPT34562.1 electron transport complex subunit RsxA [Bacillota bacterium]HPZ65482.1 electron transport complex subunit RsxA [Bacillota bacterium]
MEKLLALIFVYIFVENFVLMRFFGICPFLGVSRKMETAVGMSMAVIFVMTISTLVTWLLYTYLLEPFNLLYLQIVAFILVIASLVQLVETVLRKISPTLYQGLGIYLPLITTNCAVLAVALLAVQEEYSLLESLVFAISAAVGFSLALIIMAGIRERLELANVPKAFQGTAITLITAGILSLAFMGFKGMLSI